MNSSLFCPYAIWFIPINTPRLFLIEVGGTASRMNPENIKADYRAGDKYVGANIEVLMKKIHFSMKGILYANKDVELWPPYPFFFGAQIGLKPLCYCWGLLTL